MKKNLFILVTVFSFITQNANSQMYPSGSWVRQVTPRSMPQQRYETFEEARIRNGVCDPDDAHLYEQFAYRDNSGNQTDYPESERADASFLKYMGQVGQYINTFEYPLKNLRIKYKYAGKNNSGHSVFYMASNDLVNGTEYINKQSYLIVFSNGTVGIGNSSGMSYFKATNESKVQQRISERAASGYSGGGSNSGYNGSTYFDDGSTGSYPSGGGSNVTPRQSTPQRCPACRGTGTCLNCNGTGWYQVSHTSNNKTRCGCGNGRCRSCHGTGHR